MRWETETRYPWELSQCWFQTLSDIYHDTCTIFVSRITVLDQNWLIPCVDWGQNNIWSVKIVIFPYSVRIPYSLRIPYSQWFSVTVWAWIGAGVCGIRCCFRRSLGMWTSSDSYCFLCLLERNYYVRQFYDKHFFLRKREIFRHLIVKHF